MMTNNNNKNTYKMNKHRFNSLKDLIKTNNLALAFTMLRGFNLSDIEQAHHLANMVNEIANEASNNEVILHLFDNDLQSYLSSEGNVDYLLHIEGVGGKFFDTKLHDVFMELLAA